MPEPARWCAPKTGRSTAQAPSRRITSSSLRTSLRPASRRATVILAASEAPKKACPPAVEHQDREAEEQALVDPRQRPRAHI